MGRAVNIDCVTLPPYNQWDQAVVRDVMALSGVTFTHHRAVPAGCRHAVVVVPGRYEGAEARTAEAVASLRAAVVIVTGDEEARYVHAAVDHPSIRWWQQLPRPGLHDFARPFGDGVPPHLRAELRSLGPDVARDLDWSVSMQVNNKRRRSCVEVLEDLDGGLLNVTPGFTQGLPHDEYTRLLARTKVVPCPSGPRTPDTFRLFEALEAGCVPVADTICGDWNSRTYWEYLFGGPVPFPLVEDWTSFPGVLMEVLPDWQRIANRCAAFWMQHKRKMAGWLADDVTAVAT